MLNAPHILATALLLLTAFLIGAALGSLARLAANRLLRKPAGAASAIVVNPVTSAEPALVVAPVIEPLPNPATPVAPENVPTPDFAETMMALATGPLPEIKMPVIAPLPAVEGAAPVVEQLEPLQPAHVAGETTAGRHITSPHLQPVSPSPTMAADSQSAEVILFPSQPAPLSMAGVAAELESLLSQAVAADAEAPKSDGDEAAGADPTAAEATLPDAGVPAVVANTAAVAELPAVETTSEEAVVSAEPIEPPEVVVPPVAEATATESVDAVAVVKVPASELPTPIAAEPVQAAVDVEAEISGALPDDAAADSTAVTDRPVALAEPKMAETAAESEPEPASSEPEPTVSALVGPPVIVVAEPAVVIAAEPVVGPPELPSPQSPPAAPKLSAEEEEAAAMRAIEGNWSPRRKTRHARPPAAPEGAVETADAAVKASGAAVAAAAQAASAVVEPEPDPSKPAGLSAPRQGRADDLTHIIGVLPIIETALNNLGIYHFDQVAELGEAQIGWVETHLGIAGRIGREHWREQARELALLGELKVAAES